jgi:hypothetical protein
MDASSRLIGEKCQIVVGHTATPITTGYQAYACKVRIDDTQIKSITETGGNVVTDESWQSVALKAGIDYIPFSNGITSITLNADADSVILYLEPIGSYQS